MPTGAHKGRWKVMTKVKPRKRPTGAADAKKDRLPSLATLHKLYGQSQGTVRRGGAKPAKEDLQRLYIQEGKSIREVAAVLGCTRDKVHRALKQYGIAVRSNARRSRLRDVNLALIMADIKTKGIVATAKALDVDPATLRHFIRAVVSPEGIVKKGW